MKNANGCGPGFSTNQGSQSSDIEPLLEPRERWDAGRHASDRSDQGLTFSGRLEEAERVYLHEPLCSEGVRNGSESIEIIVVLHLEGAINPSQGNPADLEDGVPRVGDRLQYQHEVTINLRDLLDLFGGPGHGECPRSAPD